LFLIKFITHSALLKFPATDLQKTENVFAKVRFHPSAARACIGLLLNWSAVPKVILAEYF
jgi:hypothetical protein